MVHSSSPPSLCGPGRKGFHAVIQRCSVLLCWQKSLCWKKRWAPHHFRKKKRSHFWKSWKFRSLPQSWTPFHGCGYKLVPEALEDELPDEALELELLDVLPEELPDWEPDSEVTPLPMETARLLLLTVEPL